MYISHILFVKMEEAILLVPGKISSTGYFKYRNSAFSFWWNRPVGER